MLWWLVGGICLIGIVLLCVSATLYRSRFDEYPDGITRVEALRRLVNGK